MLWIHHYLCLLALVWLQTTLSFTVRPVLVRWHGVSFRQLAESNEKEGDIPNDMFSGLAKQSDAQEEEEEEPPMSFLERMALDEGDPVETFSVPLLGDLPKDNKVYFALTFTVLGFLFALVQSFRLQEDIGSAISDLANGVPAKPVENLDPNACVGVCSPTDDQVETLKSVMEAITPKK
mmetsp:Transcript_1899/g.4547  ORF Transcript_1899/g.4547 Transcript_1899/m.4547 type:complete len:179 (-) Transcript_1899:207-743(-)